MMPAVLVWARTSMVDVFGKSLSDPRVSIREADVGHLTQAIADYLATEVKLDGILYPSAQARGRAHNVVLFHRRHA
jgi:hypothetical protein